MPPADSSLTAAEVAILKFLRSRDRNGQPASLALIARTLDIPIAIIEATFERFEEGALVFKDRRARNSYHITDAGTVAIGARAL